MSALEPPPASRFSTRIRREAALEAPLLPGNVTATTSDGLLGVIGVRGLPLAVYYAQTLESSGRVDAGEGPTHVVVAGPDDDDRSYVEPTHPRRRHPGLHEARPEPGRAASAPLPGSSPSYGLLAVDPERAQLWVTLTAEKDSLVVFDISGATPREMDRYPTVVRQPNTASP